MNIDIKNLPEQDAKMLVHSLELVSARVFESVVTLSQTASSATPEMQHMFQQWLSCLGEDVLRRIEENGKLDPAQAAKEIGVTPATIISLALTLHRQGKINIKELSAEITDGENSEICGCLKK